MTSVWRREPLASFVDYISDGFTNPMPDVDSGPYLVTAKNIVGGRIDYGTSRRTTVEAFQSLTAKSKPNVGDVLLTKDGSIGRVALCDREDICINQSVACMRPNARIDAHFLSYLLQAPTYQARMAADADGSTIKHIYITRVDKMIVEVPEDLGSQRAIAAVLGALDDKIAANTALAETADALSHARFAALAKPTGAPLTDVARFVNGKAFTKGASGSGRVVVRIAELNSGIGKSTVYSDIEVAQDHTARPGDILFAWSGSLTVHRWYRPEAIINQHIFKVTPRDGYPMWLVNQVLRSRLSKFKSIASDKATTMGHIQRRHLEEVVALPSRDAIGQESEVMDGLWRIALGAEMENLTLAELRDTLLPALMSGRLRVKDAERQVEDAV